jgi:superfamily I DNA/RNA helicase
MLDTVKHKLREWGMPFHNPYRQRRGDWNPLRPGRGEHVSASDRVLAYLKLSRGHIWTYAELYLWASELEADGVLTRGAKVAMRQKYHDDLYRMLPVHAEDLKQWFTDPTAPQAAMKGDLEWFEKHLLKGRAKALAFPIQVVRRYGPERLEKPPRIILGTVHSVKGGEADIVVFFPDLSQRAAMAYTSRGADERDSVLRMAYVGVTRAKEALYIAQPSFGNEFIEIPI